MKKTFTLFLLIFLFFNRIAPGAPPLFCLSSCCPFSEKPDSLRDRQYFYNGLDWKNNFRRITGDQFLFSNVFLPGGITFNGRTFVNIELKYDIYSDELLIPRSLDQIIQLNKEMVDSFYFVFNNTIFKFRNIENNSTTNPGGYVNVLYEGRSSLWVKYVKRISTMISDYSDGRFYQVYSIFFVKDGMPFQVTKLKDIYRLLENEKDMLKKYVRDNKLKITRKEPSSFAPLIKYHDSLNK